MHSMIRRFEGGFAKLNQMIAACVAASIGLFAILVTLDFILRRYRIGGLEWLNEGAEYFLFFGVFLSATWVLQQGAHVKVDIIVSALPAKGAAVLERATDLLGALICLTMAYFGFLGGKSAHMLGSLPDKSFQIPNWVVLTIFTISFLLLTVEFLLRYYRATQHGYVQEEGVGF